MARNYSNLYPGGTLAAGISNSATAVTVSTATGLPVVFPYTLTIDKGQPTMEVVTVTAASGVNLTVVRGQDGTAAVSHSVGAPVSHDHSARDFREPQLHMDATIAHGVAGAIVGTNDTQTLTNKDLSSPTNTLASTVVRTTGAQAVTGKDLSSGNTFPTSLVTTAGSQTLTNKTLTSPAISDPSITGTAGVVNLAVTGNITNPVSNVTIDDGLVTTGNIANQGFRVPHIQVGITTVSLSAAVANSVTVTYPTAFPGTPAFISVQPMGTTQYVGTASTGTATQFQAGVAHVNSSTATTTITVSWMAVYMP